MEKIVKTLLIIFFFSLQLFAADNYLSLIQSYDKRLSIAQSDEVLRLFHSLQNIYIKSIINGDENLKEESLKRLIKSAKILGLDYTNYEKELETLYKLQGKVTPKPPKINKPKKTKPHKFNSKKDIKTLKSLYIDNYKMVLEFDSKLDKKDMKTFVLKSKNSYKRVFDIKARLIKKPRFKYPKEFKSIKIAQFNSTTLRIVLETKKSRKYRYKIDKNRFEVVFKKSKKTSPKKEKTPVVIEPIVYNNSFNPHSKIIVIDPGHGGKDVGAIGYSKRRYEKSAVLQIALKSAKELKKRGYRVYLTRSRDVFVKLRKRTGYANRKKADLFISIHANAAPKRSKYKISKGIETFFLSRARSERSKRVAALENRSDIEEMNYFSKKTFLEVLNREKIIQANKMALDVQQGMLKSLRKKYRVTDGGVREAPFWVLVGAQMPSILIEAGYITNPIEEKRLFSPTYQSLLAKGIADGIDNYFLKNR